MKFDKEKSFFLKSDEPQRKLLFANGSSQPYYGLLRTLKVIAFASYLLMLFMQMRNVILFDGQPTSDAARYVGDAMENVVAGTWYPVESDFWGQGTAGTGYVNFLIFLFRLTDNVRIAYFANILLVQLMLFSVVNIAKKITLSDTAGYVTAIFFCLFGTFWSEVCFARTEIFFTSLAVFALALAVRNGKFGVIASGAILAYANWARPLAVAFIVAIVWFFLCNGVKIRQYVKFFAGFFAVVLLLMTFTYFNSGEFIYQPTIASGNFLMGANEDADGSYDDTVFAEGKAGYIPDEVKKEMHYSEINAVYKEAGDEWIRRNPVRYLSLMPKKLFYFIATETYSFDSYFDNEKVTSGASYLKEVISVVTGKADRGIMLGDVMAIYTQIFYMLMFALFIVGVVFSLVKGYWRSMSFIYGIYLIGVAASLYTVGGARYHFPYLFVVLITAAVFVDATVIRKFKKFAFRY